MNIAVVARQNLEAYGTEQAMKVTSDLLKQAGHNVHSIVQEKVEAQSGVFVSGLFTNSLIVAPSERKKTAKQFMEVLEKVKPDVIHFSELPDVPVIEKASEKYPCVVTAHSVGLTCPASHRFPQFDSPCEKKSGWTCLLHHLNNPCLTSASTWSRKAHWVHTYLARIDAAKKSFKVHAISDYLKDRLYREGWKEEQVHRLYHPIVASPFAEKKSSTPFKLLVASRLAALKGHQTLWHALGKISSLNWNLEVIGEGEERAKLERLAQELDLSSRIKFLGRLNHADTLSKIKNSDLLIQPNEGPEGFGLSVAEAMAEGTPVLVSDMPALSELVTEERGWIYLAHDSENLAVKIHEIMAKGPARSLKARAAYDFVVQELNPQKFTQKLVEIYNQ